MKAQRLFEDIISTLPQNIIENILCLVPIQDAVRTSILSTEWRFKWTTIPKLVFNYKDMFKKSSDENQLSILEQSFEEPPSERKHLSKRCKVFYAIFQVLLLHEGPIHEFTLSMNANDTSVEIDQIMRHLSKSNTLKKLTIHLKFVLRYTVPVSVLSLHHLTNLHLRDCNFDHRPPFNVFGSLTSFYMEEVNTNTETLLYLISKSPLLKSLTVLCYSSTINPHGLVLPDYFHNSNNSTITNLFECLHLIEHLSVTIWVIKYFVGDSIPRELPVSLVHLKYLYLDEMCFIDKCGLPLLVLFIRCSPNVEKIKLQVLPELSKYHSQSEIESVTLEDYLDIRLEHLNELEIDCSSNLKAELEFVKLIVAKSPVLKKVKIFIYSKAPKDEEVKVLRILLQAPCASSVIKFLVERRA